MTIRGGGGAGGSGPLTLALTEEATTRLMAEGTDADGRVAGFRWGEAPVEEGAIEACQAVDGFDPTRAADSLAAACSVEGCTPAFETLPPADIDPSDDAADEAATDPSPEADGESPETGSVESSGSATFDVTLPALRAPVGLTYELIATDDRGGERATPVTFCVVSINEAPEAVDDSFSVLEGSVLDVDADVLNLLSNDADDIDSSNEPLQVLAEPVRPPIAADVFELREDGGFTYAFTGTSLTSDIVDSFDYAITDGTFTSTATATIRIVQRDDPPELVRQLPELEAVEGLPFEFDLASYFEDPEGADLGFDILAGELPPSGEITLSPIGVLAGSAAEADAGDYAFTVAASDGTLAAEADVALTVFDNEPVVAKAIPAQRARVNRRIRFGVARYFTDPESASLAFRLSAAADAALNMTIDTSSGIVTGFATEPGRYELSVTASDGFNRPIAGAVDLVVAQ